jgi:hypothetical protein
MVYVRSGSACDRRNGFLFVASDVLVSSSLAIEVGGRYDSNSPLVITGELGLTTEG